MGTKDAPGNNGLKDQVEALKWVKTNIPSFGGDQNNVIILGYSVGAMSVILHLMSPMSQGSIHITTFCMFTYVFVFLGLFHKVIAMSYSPLGALPIGKNQLQLAKKQARLVGCSDNSASIIYNCLKNVSAEKLGDSLYEFAVSC